MLGKDAGDGLGKAGRVESKRSEGKKAAAGRTLNLG